MYYNRFIIHINKSVFLLGLYISLLSGVDKSQLNLDLINAVLNKDIKKAEKLP